MAVRAAAQSSRNYSGALLLGGSIFLAGIGTGLAWEKHETKLKLRSIQEETDRYIARKKQETERYKLEADRYIARKKQETERYKLEAQTERGLFDAALKQRAGRVAPSPTQQQL